jgi:SAM-dependent methyltransferase
LNAENKQLDATQILTPERFREYEQSIIDSDRVLSALDLIKTDDSRILDVGGASGVFLDELEKKNPFRSELFNLEFDDAHRGSQVNNRINFIHGSILNSDIANDFFDLVTARHILHHLIGPTLRDTLANQRRAIEEMCRITKKGGYILLEEEVNNVKLFSKLANKYKIQSKTFDAGTVIVSFMTPGEVKETIETNRAKYRLEIERYQYVPRDMPLQWKLTLLMASVGDVFWVLKKT